ncbi:uncharacterized protein LOC105420395 [Amborella trichopoda]|uniref:uncharacterized protein LOC105420395 n=1 Tax=Amborella trichopoda TaxID=13333 RepID=UPI0005D3F889|nr:uncharacterized protein LOC105420395 [Amborella trichopoda]|eukprot:XP_011622134.1 uncharacterized protein LOC105420395 [Amborella trichopoda]
MNAYALLNGFKSHLGGDGDVVVVLKSGALVVFRRNEAAMESSFQGESQPFSGDGFGYDHRQAPMKSMHAQGESQVKRSDNDGSKEVSDINTCSEEDENGRLGSPNANKRNIGSEPSEEETKLFYNEYTRPMRFSMCMGNMKKTQREGSCALVDFYVQENDFVQRKLVVENLLGRYLHKS